MLTFHVQDESPQRVLTTVLDDHFLWANDVRLEDIEQALADVESRRTIPYLPPDELFEYDFQQSTSIDLGESFRFFKAFRNVRGIAHAQGARTSFFLLTLGVLTLAHTSRTRTQAVSDLEDAICWRSTRILPSF